MADATFDRGFYFSSRTDWYRDRPFKVAFAVSVAIHAALIAVLPGLHAVPADTPPVLQVEIAQMAAPEIPLTEPAPTVPPRQVEPIKKPVPQPRRQESPPEPLVQKAQPERPVVPRDDIIHVPHPETNPQFVVPKVEPPAQIEQAKPEPKIEHPPAPIARVEPPSQPAVERAPDPLPETKTNTVPDARPVPPEPAIVAPQAKAPDDSQQRASTDLYTQLISAQIRKHQNYPFAARRNQWQGTTVVQLRFTAEGLVTEIAVVEKSGHEMLDEAAVKMVRSASPLPVPPEGVRSVRLPIHFKLQS
jgi:periplasmic protein TonB